MELNIVLFIVFLFNFILQHSILHKSLLQWSFFDVIEPIWFIPLDWKLHICNILCNIMRSKFYYKYLSHVALLIWKFTKQDQIFEFQIITFFPLKSTTFWKGRHFGGLYRVSILFQNYSFCKTGGGGSLRSLLKL